MKKKIEIEICEREFGMDFKVQWEDKIADRLTFDEMLGLVASLTMPEHRPCLAWMKTQNQIDEFERYLKSIKHDSVEGAPKLSEILKPGESGWFRRRDGKIANAFRVPYGCDRPIWWWTRRTSGSVNACGFVSSNGESEHDLVEHLPDCTGFDWEPVRPAPMHVPWDVYTMPDRVLIRVKDREGVYVARPMTERHVQIGLNPIGVSYVELCNEFEQLDGTPCGRSQ